MMIKHIFKYLIYRYTDIFSANSVSKKLRFLTDDSKYSLFTTRDILRLVIPLFFEQLLFKLVGSADTLMVAGLGEASISAVSLVDMFNNCTSSIIIALATGGAVVAARSWRRGRGGAVVAAQYIGAKSLLRARKSEILSAHSTLNGTLWADKPEPVRKVSPDICRKVNSFHRGKC